MYVCLTPAAPLADGFGVAFGAGVGAASSPLNSFRHVCWSFVTWVVRHTYVVVEKRLVERVSEQA